MTLRPHPKKKTKTLNLALFIVNMPKYAFMSEGVCCNNEFSNSKRIQKTSEIQKSQNYPMGGAEGGEEELIWNFPQIFLYIFLLPPLSFVLYFWAESIEINLVRAKIK